MDTAQLVIIIVAVVIVALAVVVLVRQRRSKKLRTKFGPEYDRMIRQEHGRARQAEAILEKREKRVEKLNLRHLTPVECDRFRAEWRLIQEQFVDDPTTALARAEALVNQALRTRGYPMTNYEQGIADVSVELPHAVDRYRSAHEIAERHSQARATTEELRRAMQNYRELLEEVLEVQTQHPVEVHR